MTPYKYATIMSGIVVRWKFAGDDRNGYDAEINASRDGVSICGCWPIMKPKLLAEVVTALGAAVSVHERLKTGDDLSDIPSAPVFGTPQRATPAGSCEKFLNEDSEVRR